MNSRYDVIGPNTLEAIRRDSEIIRLKTRIEKLEAALRTVKEWHDYGLPPETTRMIDTALEGKDD